MDNVALAWGLGMLIGVVLFFVLALSGYVDKWTAHIEKWLGER